MQEHGACSFFVYAYNGCKKRLRGRRLKEALAEICDMIATLA